jgi:flavin reductase (DIM6/NTAB) family NADH-FMN oxidoreductase RutF
MVGADGVARGMTVGSFTSLSLNPPLVLACIGDAASIAPAIQGTTHIGVSVLASDQAELSRRFADTVARTFEGIAHHHGPAGMPLLDGAVTHLEARIVARHRGGDHTIIVAEVSHAVTTDREPLAHLRRRYGRVVPLGSRGA